MAELVGDADGHVVRACRFGDAARESVSLDHRPVPLNQLAN